MAGERLDDLDDLDHDVGDLDGLDHDLYEVWKLSTRATAGAALSGSYLSHIR